MQAPYGPACCYRSGFVLALVIYWLAVWQEYIATASSVLSPIALIFGVLSLRGSQKQRLRQFEAFYVARYWGLMDNLSIDALRGVGGPVVDGDEKVVRSYIRLCEDECELRAAGWIGDSTWSIWSDGMVQQFERWPFGQVWEEVRIQQPDLYQHLRRMIDEGCDVPRLSRRKRFRAGLTSRPGV